LVTNSKNTKSVQEGLTCLHFGSTWYLLLTNYTRTTRGYHQ